MRSPGDMGYPLVEGNVPFLGSARDFESFPDPTALQAKMDQLEEELLGARQARLTEMEMKLQTEYQALQEALGNR